MTKTACVKGTVTDGPHLREVDITIRYNHNEWGETISFSTDDSMILSVPVMDIQNMIQEK